MCTKFWAFNSLLNKAMLKNPQNSRTLLSLCGTLYSIIQSKLILIATIMSVCEC